MSWLFKSLQSDDPDSPPQNNPTHRNRGVKGDLSVIGENIGRQLRGVAAFLAPPPTTEHQPQPQSRPSDPSSSQALEGIRNDLLEIGGSFKSGLLHLSSNKAVTGLSKFASNLLQFQNQDDDDFEGVPGITDEVVDFVKEISLRSECWTDFPLSVDDDFEMSDAQREHIYAVEHLVPSFSDLRNSLYDHLGDNQFWMIYFILLLPRLNEDDFELLSTPKIIETRNMLLWKLQNKRNTQMENSNTPDASEERSEVCETRRENIVSGEKEVTEIVKTTKGLEIEDEENIKQWLEETDTDTVVSTNTEKKIQQHEEDVSFSDLEDDSNDLSSRLSAQMPAQGAKATSPSGSNDWVRLTESSVNQGDQEKARQSTSRDKDSEGESSDWLAVDDFD